MSKAHDENFLFFPKTPRLFLQNKAEMQAIGAGALNQAVKAIAIARGFVAPAGVDLVCIPAFAEVEVEGEDRTGIKLIVESRK